MPSIRHNMATKDAKEKMSDGLGRRKGGMYLDPWVDGFSLFVEYFTTPVHQISTLSGKCKFRWEAIPIFHRKQNPLGGRDIWGRSSLAVVTLRDVDTGIGSLLRGRTDSSGTQHSARTHGDIFEEASINCVHDRVRPGA